MFDMGTPQNEIFDIGILEKEIAESEIILEEVSRMITDLQKCKTDDEKQERIEELKKFTASVKTEPGSQTGVCFTDSLKPCEKTVTMVEEKNEIPLEESKNMIMRYMLAGSATVLVGGAIFFGSAISILKKLNFKY